MLPLFNLTALAILTTTDNLPLQQNKTVLSQICSTNGKPSSKAALRMAKLRKSRAPTTPTLVDTSEISKYQQQCYEDNKYCDANGLDFKTYRVANRRRIAAQGRDLQTRA